MIEPERYIVGKRYLHGKTDRPVTLRYIGTLPPSASPADSHSSSSSAGPIWLGIEYDDPSFGKHSGVYQGQGIFDVRAEGAGSFVKASAGVLKDGPTLVEALQERYGPLLSPEPGTGSSTSLMQSTSSLAERVHLGTSGITVDAPGLSAVQARIGRLEKLREVGLDNGWVSGLGGTEEQREAMKVRLKNVHRLDLTGNLLQTWQDVAEIARHLHGLKTLFLSTSRIAALPIDVQDAILNELIADLKGIEELHLGNAGMAWSEVASVMRIFPNVQVLHLHDNAKITRLDTPFPPNGLTTLSLGGCHISSWTEIARFLGGPSRKSCETAQATCAGISHLDITKTGITSIPTRPADSAALTSLTTLVMRQSGIRFWTDIDALETWTCGSLNTMRFSLADVIDDSDDESETRPRHPSADPTRISGRSKADRQMFIAKLSGLTSLNLTPVSAGERRDAEMWYVNRIREAQDPSSWGRYDELRTKYDMSAATAVPASSRSAALKSRMISEIFLASRDGYMTDLPAVRLHLIDGTEEEMRYLPSAPMTLLRKKIAKRLGTSVVLWTVRHLDGETEKVAEMTDGHDVAWWLNDGDGIIVEPDA